MAQLCLGIGQDMWRVWVVASVQHGVRELFVSSVDASNSVLLQPVAGIPLACFVEVLCSQRQRNCSFCRVCYQLIVLCCLREDYLGVAVARDAPCMSQPMQPQFV